MESLLALTGVAAMITGSLSLVGILIRLWMNYKQNLTNRYTEIITKRTLENNRFVRENSEIVTVLTRPEIIDDARTNKDKDYKKTLMRAEVNLEHQLKYCVHQEKHMIEDLRSLVKLSFQYYDHPSAELKSNLCKVGEDYYKIMTIYDYADWQYIKAQAKSQAYNKQCADFLEIYRKLELEEFKKDELPTRW